MKKINIVITLLCFAAGQASSEPFEKTVEEGIAGIKIPGMTSERPSAPAGEVITIPPPPGLKTRMTDFDMSMFLRIGMDMYRETGMPVFYCGKYRFAMRGNQTKDGSFEVRGYDLNHVYSGSSIQVEADGSFRMTGMNMAAMQEEIKATMGLWRLWMYFSTGEGKYWESPNAKDKSLSEDEKEKQRRSLCKGGGGSIDPGTHRQDPELLYKDRPVLAPAPTGEIIATLPPPDFARTRLNDFSMTRLRDLATRLYHLNGKIRRRCGYYDFEAEGTQMPDGSFTMTGYKISEDRSYLNGRPDMKEVPSSFILHVAADGSLQTDNIFSFFVQQRIARALDFWADALEHNRCYPNPIVERRMREEIWDAYAPGGPIGRR